MSPSPSGSKIRRGGSGPGGEGAFDKRIIKPNIHKNCRQPNDQVPAGRRRSSSNLEFAKLARYRPIIATLVANLVEKSLPHFA